MRNSMYMYILTIQIKIPNKPWPYEAHGPFKSTHDAQQYIDILCKDIDYATNTCIIPLQTPQVMGISDSDWMHQFR